MSTRLTKDGTQICAGTPQGLADTHEDQLNADLPAFLGTWGRLAGAAISLSSISAVSNALRRRKAKL